MRNLLPATALPEAAGRKVLDLHAGPNDVSRLTPGVYFALSARQLARVVLVR